MARTAVTLAFTAILLISYTGATVVEVCPNLAESLHLSCGQSEVIVMKEAWFGRMRLGRCVTSDLGYLGCATNVLHLADRRCSGRQTCQALIPNKELVEVTECSTDYSLYLEVDYECIKGTSMSSRTCDGVRQMRLSGDDGFIPSLITDQSGCGSTQSPWIIEGAPGQRINITMMDFSSHDSSQQATIAHRCNPFGFIVERKLGINKTVCGGVARRSHVYTSASNSIELHVLKARPNNAHFLMRYEVTGCPDATPPAHAWYKRTGNMAEIGCEWSKTSWELKCEGNSWVGVVGNCSAKGLTEVESKETLFSISPVISVGVMIALAVVAFILVVIISCGYRCMKKRSPAEGSPTLPHSDIHKAIKSPAMTSPAMPTYSQVRKKPRVTSATHAFVPAGGPPPSSGVRTPPPVGGTAIRGPLPARSGADRPIWERTLPTPAPRGQHESLYQPIITHQEDTTLDDATWGQHDSTNPSLSLQNTLPGPSSTVIPASSVGGQDGAMPRSTSSGQQMSTEGDYLTPCRTGTARETVSSTDYEPFAAVTGRESELSAENDYNWDTESEFQYFGPDLGTGP